MTERLVDEDRLGELSRGRDPELFARIARDWVAALPAAADRLRAASPVAVVPALHELRSGAVAVGLPHLAAMLAAIEQRAEGGSPPSAAELEEAITVAERSGRHLLRWWEQAIPLS